jgi:peroxin-12
MLPTADIYPPLPQSELSESEESEDGRIAPNQRYEIGTDDYGKCPLCRRKWQNPAILESGWVVCWRCGWDALHADEEDEGETGKDRSKSRCPITGVEVSRNDLRRVLL